MSMFVWPEKSAEEYSSQQVNPSIRTIFFEKFLKESDVTLD